MRQGEFDKGRLIELVDPFGFVSIRGEFRSRFVRLAEILAKVVCPAIHEDSSLAIKSSIARLLAEMRECGFPVLAAEAACLPLNLTQTADICNRINQSLMSNQNNVLVDGLNAIVTMIINGVDTEAVPANQRPDSMLYQHVTWGHARFIHQTLWTVRRIMKDAPSSFTSELEAATQMRLGQLLLETAYDNDKSSLVFADKLTVRQAAASLAATIWRHYQSRNLPVPPVVEKWRVTCESPDEFAEIRTEWDDGVNV